MKNLIKTTPLLINEEGAVAIAEVKKAEWKNSIALKVFAFGSNGLFFAGHVLVNSKFLSLLGHEGASAAALVSTYQAVIVGSGVGTLLGTGLDFGKAVGKKSYKEAGDIAKTALILSSGLSLAASAALLATRGVFPLIFEAETAKLASAFFTGYAAAPFSLLFLVVAPQVAFQEGDWYLPPLSMLSVLVFSGAASYCLGFTADLGALGIGLGGSVGSLLAATVTSGFFLKPNYRKFTLLSLPIEDFIPKLKSLLSSGWKLALQRLTEWGNLLALTSLVGRLDNNNLKALNPAMSYLVLFGTSLQGFAQAAGMMIAKNKGEIRKAIDESDHELVAVKHADNIKVIFRSNFFGIALNSALAFSAYWAREPLAAFFLPESANETVQEFSEELLWVSMLGLIPDACRLISAGALRGWMDLLYPTIVSLLLMTVVGIPSAYGLGQVFEDDTQMLLYARNVTMLLSGLLIFKRCHSKIKADESTELQDYIKPPSFFGTGLSFFSKKPKQLPELSNTQTALVPSPSLPRYMQP